MNIWRVYIGHLYEDTCRPDRAPEFGRIDNGMTENVERAMSQIKKDESPGPDNVYDEFSKLVDKEGV